MNMAEQREDDFGWKDNPYEAQRQKTKEHPKKGKSSARTAPLSSTSEPGNPASQKPWNTEMVRPDKTGAYRKVTPEGKVVKPNPLNFQP